VSQVNWSKRKAGNIGNQSNFSEPLRKASNFKVFEFLS
jgi:hypothetical protein